MKEKLGGQYSRYPRKSLTFLLVAGAVALFLGLSTLAADLLNQARGLSGELAARFHLVAVAEGALLQLSPTSPSTWELEEEIPGSGTGRSDGISRRNLAVDPAGNAYVLWEYDRGIDDPSPERSEIRFAHRPDVGGWTEPATIVTRGVSCGSCHTSRTGIVPAAIAVDPTGNALALWLGWTGSGNSDYTGPHVASRPATGT